MYLSGHESKRLREAIISAYPNQPDLEIMVSDQLEENLNAIAGGDNINQVVFRLIKWAESRGKLKLENLIIGAYRSNPGNQELEEFYQTIFQQKFIVHPVPINPGNTGICLPEPPILNKERYNVLEKLLTKNRWEEANKETLNLMIEVSGMKTTDSWNERYIQQLPCDVLFKIDQLWKQYSNDCFSFTVQKRIWKEKCINMRNSTKAFGYYVGWYNEDRERWLSLSEPVFRSQIAWRHNYKGILPTLTSNNSSMEVNASLISYIVAKLESCNCN